jgi:hypothetical protein
MNERIKQLEKQCWRSTQSDPYALFDVKKFAELIVRECASIVAKRKDQAIDEGWNVDEAMSMAEIDLEEHFGVKE